MNSWGLIYPNKRIESDVATSALCAASLVRSRTTLGLNTKYETSTYFSQKGSSVEIIAIINYKGGVGKTTTTANIAAKLAFKGKRVLIIDSDAQASLTFSFVHPDDWDENLGNYILDIPIK